MYEVVDIGDSFQVRKIDGKDTDAAAIVLGTQFRRYEERDGWRREVKDAIPGAKELSYRIRDALNAAPACATCSDLTTVKVDGAERACPDCQPAMAAEEARDQPQGF